MNSKPFHLSGRLRPTSESEPHNPPRRDPTEPSPARGPEPAQPQPTLGDPTTAERVPGSYDITRPLRAIRTVNRTV